MVSNLLAMASTLVARTLLVVMPELLVAFLLLVAMPLLLTAMASTPTEFKRPTLC